jgi:flagellar export protein FliJ
MRVTMLRHYRQQVEEALRAELAELELVLQAAEENLRQLEAEVDSDARQYMADAGIGLTADEVAGRYAELDALAGAIQKARAIAEEARLRRDQKVGEVLEASREKKKLEILDRRKALRAQQELDRREQQAVDEIASRRFIADGQRQPHQRHR